MIPLDRRFAEIRRRDLAAEPTRQEVELQRQERVARLRQLRRPCGRNDEEPRAVQSSGQIAEEVGRRRIRPVHIVEPQHDGLQPAGLFEQRRDLALEPLLRAARRLGGKARRGRIVLEGGMSCAYQLGASARTRRVRLPSCSFRWRLSSASRTGRYASLPASRSEHRPRPTRAGSPRASSSATKASTSVVLPAPASPEMTTMRAFPRCARSNSWFIASSSSSRPTMLVLVARRRGRDGDRRQRGRDVGVVREREAVHHLARARPEPPILLQRLEDELIERARKLGIEQRRRLGRLPQERVQCSELRRSHERVPSGDELVQHDAEREHIGFSGDSLAARLFRRHVPDSAENQAGLGPRRSLDRRSGAKVLGLRARQPEVEQLDVAIRPHHDVVRLDVAMDDLRRVRDRQRFGHLPRDADDARERQSLRRQLPQRRALDELHRDVAVASPTIPGLVDGDDVGVVERRGQRRFPQQTVERRFLVFRAPPDDLERDVPAKPRIERAIHLTHAPGAEQGADLVQRRKSPR